MSAAGMDRDRRGDAGRYTDMSNKHSRGFQSTSQSSEDTTRSGHDSDLR